ncbi:DedA family protein [Demequina sp. NBRC 110056]|uniref:DedA family protein n=1 Tax=Demequina sp. NBRC 110056 TaxID=1570345 RepID=UPI000A026BD2|nr:VTT domain-containing protein [Demequina sp. NBRC 110056]
MPGIPDFVMDGPWWWLFLALVLIVFVRTQATYWLARWARAGADAVADRAEKQDSKRARIARRFSGPGMTKAQAFTERWGWIAIPLSFLTIGIQSLVNGGAGYARMHWGRYTLAMIPGCLLWAGAYELVGFSAWRAFTTSPWVLAGSVVLVGAVVAVLVVRRRRRQAADEAQPATASAPVVEA